MIRRSLALLGAIAVASFIANSAHADISYSLAFGQSTYYVLPGGAVDVDVYLIEEGSESLVNDGDGLWLAGVSVTREATVATEAAFIDSTALTRNPGLDSELAQDLSVGPGGAWADVELLSDEPPGPMISGDSVYLFTLTIHGGTVVGEVTPFSVSLIPSTGIWNWDFIDFSDSTNSGPDTEIVIIPEPATAMLAAAGLLLIFSRRRSSL